MEGSHETVRNTRETGSVIIKPLNALSLNPRRPNACLGAFARGLSRAAMPGLFVEDVWGSLAVGVKCWVGFCRA